MFILLQNTFNLFNISWLSTERKQRQINNFLLNSKIYFWFLAETLVSIMLFSSDDI